MNSTFFIGRGEWVIRVLELRVNGGAYNYPLMVFLVNLSTNYCCMVKRKHASGLRHQTQTLNSSTNGGDASRVGIVKGNMQALLNNSYIFSRRGTRRPH